MKSNKLVIGLYAERSYKEVSYPHMHLRAQLLYASHGTIQVLCNDQVWIVPPKCAVWIPARVEHSMVCLSQVKLNTALIDAQAAAVMGNSCFLIRVSDLLHELLIRLNLLEAESVANQTHAEALLNALEILIFDEIQTANSLPIQIPWPKDKRLSRICDLMMQSPQHTKDLNTWADEMGTSSRTLMRLFKKQTGLSYRGWIQQMHIALALSKIADGQSMSSIAEALGYSSPSAFSAMFKRHLGITPQQFKSYEMMEDQNLITARNTIDK